jgi:hypothetical protein
MDGELVQFSFDRRWFDVNINSVSGYSGTLWDEYLEQLKKKQTQGDSGTVQASSAADKQTSASALSPDQIISELLDLQDDPEKLKARAAELAAEASAEAGNSVGIKANVLNELASDLEAVAEDGDLSVIQEKVARRSGGASGISTKLTEAILEEDEDEEDASTLESIKNLLAEIQKLIEKEEKSNISTQTESDLLTPEQILSELEGLQDDPETLKARASELASQLNSEASGINGPLAGMIGALVSDLETVAESGDLSSLKEKIERGHPRAVSATEPSGTGSAAYFETLVSKFQSIKESNTVETSDVADEDGDIEAAVDSLIEKVRANLTSQLRALYAQTQEYPSSVSLSG